jgi:hypothetical protein
MKTQEKTSWTNQRRWLAVWTKENVPLLTGILMGLYVFR